MTDTPMSRSDASRLDQAIRDLTAEMRQTRTEFTTSINGLSKHMDETFVRKDVLEPRLQAMQGDINETSSWITWAQRLVLALVITAVVGTVLVSGGVIKT